MYNNIDELMNPALQEEFCKQVGAEELMVYENHVIATVEECTECYYGRMLLQPAIVGEYSFEEIESWKQKEFEKLNLEKL